MSKKKQLSDKRQLFIAEYIANNCNATKAYASVYSVNEESARREGSRLLSNVDIKAEIDKEIDKILEDKKALALQVVNEYKKLAFSDIKNYINPITGENVINENTDTSIIESIQFDIVKKTDKEDKNEWREKFKFKLYNKQSALDSLSKFIIGFSEKHDLSIPDGIEIVYKNKTKNAEKD
jgi:phage terminase small subunit